MSFDHEEIHADQPMAPERSGHGIRMSYRTLAVLLALLTVAFIVLNFTVEGAGTIFLILAVAAGFASAYFFRKT